MSVLTCFRRSLPFTLAACAASLQLGCTSKEPTPLHNAQGSGGNTQGPGSGGDSASTSTDESTTDSDTDSGVPGSGGAGQGAAGEVSPFIVVDQFGYLPDAEKIAVLRDPEQGFDAAEAYTLGSKYQLIAAASGALVRELEPQAWNGGQVHAQSGDRAWWLDFSTFTTPGEYYVADVDAGTRSDVFVIGDDVYREVLRQALRTFFYQRAAFKKEAAFAGEGWADEASHLGQNQDPAARLYGALDDASTERELSGGWYDAGDYNRYTAWEADYVTTFLRMYDELKETFGDDLNIPESGNGLADVLDEAKFGLTHLIKLQSESGGCLSVLGTDPQYESASPPSALDAQAVYGPETTNATLRAGIAFAWGARVFAESDAALAADLLARAQAAWSFAEANPDLVFENTGKIAAGEQQSSPDEVELYKLGLAVSLYRASGDAAYKDFFELGYGDANLELLTGYNAGWQLQFTEFYLDYTQLPDADPTIKQEILDAFVDTMDSEGNLGMLTAQPDPYLGYIDTYTWGSNAHKARTGCLLYDVITFNIDERLNVDARRAAERFIHYLHGVNPLGLVYLTNMGAFGAHHSANTIYHSWFTDGSAEWDEVGTSTFGPPPGFVPGGPNPGYELDGSCPGQSGCPAQAPSPPAGQPDMKSYLDFNDNWPVNSWSVSENSNGYQTYYIRLLSKFVR